MDLNQRRLTRDEWNGIEVPVNEREKMILNLIIRGFNDVQIKQNNNLSVIDFLKLSPFDTIDEYIYETYLVPLLLPIVKYSLPSKLEIVSIERYTSELLSQMEGMPSFI